MFQCSVGVNNFFSEIQMRNQGSPEETELTISAYVKTFYEQERLSGNSRHVSNKGDPS